MQCPKCSYKNSPGSPVCMLCGVELVEELESPAGDPSQADDAASGSTPTGVDSGPITELYLHCFVRDPIRLDMETPATIGRVDGNDIVLPAKIVSRRHCKVEYRDGCFYAVDLGSSNGTYVNEQKTEAAPVGPGDEIRIGSFIIHCTDSGEGESQDEDASATMVVSAVGGDSTTGFAGRLEEMGLGEVTTIVEMTRKTGTLVMHIRAGMAKIFFKDGQIINAEGLGEKGADAFFALFLEKEGTFEFDQGTPLVKKVIDMPTMSLLLEAARNSDEAGR